MAPADTFTLRRIGVIHTPYTLEAPYQPIEEDSGEFYVELDARYADGLRELDAFRYVYLIYHIHRLDRPVSMVVSPPWTDSFRVGLFASRSPLRPNPIGLSVVRLKGVEGNRVMTSGVDVFDGTPLLDIKPYLRDLDSKADANYGWLEQLPDMSHLALHIYGIPHDY